jgi:hypothetical protein
MAGILSSRWHDSAATRVRGGPWCEAFRHLYVYASLNRDTEYGLFFMNINLEIEVVL